MQFVINIPQNFSRDLLRGDRPAILVEADATDPGRHRQCPRLARQRCSTPRCNNDLKGPLASLNATAGPVDLRVHALYNPEIITQYNIVPGLMGVILTMTMIMITGLAITRERERGTMENLLSMPTRPIEVLIGKIVPYILVGYIQVTLILVAAHFLFHVPMLGSIPLLLVVALVFIAANLAMGITFSTIAQEPAPGHADDLLRLPALDPALRLHVSLPRHAASGRRRSAKSCRSPISCASSAASCSRATAFSDVIPRALAHRALRRRRPDHRREALPPDAGLIRADLEASAR